MKKQLVRAAAATVLGLSLTAGIASADVTTGPGSYNHQSTHSKVITTTTNNNNIKASSSNAQTATTGTAEVHYNTTGGSAISGDATNSTSFNVTAAVSNDASANLGSATAAVVPPVPQVTGSVTTGPGSTNTETYDSSVVTKVVNNNNVTVTSSNSQSAKSGNATVTDNTTGGSATTGSASNSSDSTVDISVNN